MRFSLALAGALLAVPAYAQDHVHPTETLTGEVAAFYEAWKRPDDPGISCCNKKDCYPTEARFRDGKWYARQRETGTFQPVPPDRIEVGRDNPDGRNHVCMSDYGHVWCFIVGAGG